MDNASSHKTKLIRDWFAKRPNWHPHFTPTSSSWINQVERFFALLTEQQIKRGAHRSTKELEAAIRAYVDARNADPKPFRWTKTADDILASKRESRHFWNCASKEWLPATIPRRALAILGTSGLCPQKR